MDEVDVYWYREEEQGNIRVRGFRLFRVKPSSDAPHFSKRPWTLAILFFLMTVIIAASLPFLLGRIVSIETEILVSELDEIV